jgi:hypothetical protein
VHHTEDELLALLPKFLECRSYEGLHEVTKRFDRLYFWDDQASPLAPEPEEFFDEVNDRLSTTGGFGDLTLEQFQDWLRGALAQYPTPTRWWQALIARRPAVSPSA